MLKMGNLTRPTKETMVNSNVYDSPEEPSLAAVPTLLRRFRWRTGLALFGIGTVATALVNRTASNDTDRVIRTYEAVAITLLALMIWWVFLSGTRLWTRILCLLLLCLALGGGAMLCVRNVEFTGDMRPIFWFVWDPPSPSEKAQEWLNQNAPTSNITAVPDVPTDQNSEATETRAMLTITTADWPQNCGLHGSREIVEPQCSFDWTNNAPKELWRHPVGDAWSSFTVVGERLFTQEQRGPLECVVCYNADTGQELWRHEDTARYETAQGGIGPRATPTVTEETIFALGATGILNALDPFSGKKIWQRNICDDAESSLIEWGMSGSPMIYKNMVIVDAGGYKNKAVIAYDRANGEIVWASGNHPAGYATPRLETIDGTLTLLIFHGDGLQGLDPATGQHLWEYPWTNQYKINVAQPMLFGNHLFLSSGYDSGCVLIDPTTLQEGKPADVWPPNKNLKLKFNEAVQRENHVYGLDDGILACIDVKTGKRLWKGGRYRHGQVLLWGNKLIVQAESGDVAVVEASPKEFKEVTRLAALTDRTWNLPIVNRGRLYARNASEAVCYELPIAK